MRFFILIAVLLLTTLALAGEAPPQPERAPTIEELLVAQGRTEAQRDMLATQAQGQIDQLNQRLQAIAAEIAKLRGGGDAKGKSK